MEAIPTMRRHKQPHHCLRGGQRTGPSATNFQRQNNFLQFIAGNFLTALSCGDDPPHWCFLDARLVRTSGTSLELSWNLLMSSSNASDNNHSVVYLCLLSEARLGDTEYFLGWLGLEHKHQPTPALALSPLRAAGVQGSARHWPCFRSEKEKAGLP